ncbi:MAG: hypothetical protein V3T70_04420, partial [Phycisphaerae bacterium]
MKGIFFVVTLAVAAGATTVSKAAIAFGQLDDFEGGTVMNWKEGFFSPNPPTNVPNGGPSGLGDNYLRNVSSGGMAAGGRMVMFNQVQWTGDYLGAGVNRIDADMANFGATLLFMRIAVEGIPGQRYGSANAVALPADGNWYPVSFDLTVAAMSPIIGTVDSLNVVLSNVSTLRILSAQAGPSWEGDVVAATLG